MKYKKIRIISLMSFLLMASCSIDMGESEEASSSNREYTGEEIEINVSVYAAGYGKGWINEACRIYEEKHPEYRFKIRANSRMFDTVKTELNTGVCQSDIVLVASYDYLNLATNDKLEEISSVYDSVIEDNNKKVIDVTSIEQYQKILVGENKDRVYGIPWQDSYCSGFIYNKKLFAENNWSVPQTMDEFFTLCDKISEKNIAPLVYGGGQQNGYVGMVPPQWLVQYYGYDYIQNTFEKYESPVQYKDTEEGRLKAYQTLARLLKGTTKNGNNIALTGSNAFTAQAAQREFLKGNAAMDICGAWFPTEMSTILKDYPDFEYGFFNLPHINSDLKDCNGNDTSNVNYSLQANLLAIPTTSKHKDVAKDFLLSMYTKESYTTFVKENNGITRPIDVEIDESVLNEFSKSVYSRAKESKKNNICVYETSTSPMATNGYLGLMNFSAVDYYARIINSASYEDALDVANTASSADYQTALSFWDSKTNNWDEKYLTIK